MYIGNLYHCAEGQARQWFDNFNTFSEHHQHVIHECHNFRGNGLHKRNTILSGGTETLFYLILNTTTCQVDVVVASSLGRVHGLVEW
jgi:hypothetical protein